MNDIMEKARIISTKVERIDDLKFQYDEIDGYRDRESFNEIFTNKDIEDLLNVIRLKIELAENDLEKFIMEMK